MSTRTAWSALRIMRRAQRRRDLRRPSTYVVAVGSFGAVWLLQHYAGIGATATGERPTGTSTGMTLILLLVISVAGAGLLGPELSIPSNQAQWLATAPGGASAALAAKLLLYAGVAVRLTAYVIAAQLIASGEVDLLSAGVLGLWRAGLGLTGTAARYGFASYLERSSRPRLRRAVGATILASVGYLMTTVQPLMQVLGAPAGATTTTALLSAIAWVAVGGLFVLAALIHAEDLVVRAVAAGGPGGLADQRRLRTAKRRLAEPDSFVLHGPRVLLWRTWLFYRRGLKGHLALFGVLSLAAVALGVYAAQWLPALYGAVLLLIVAITTSAAAAPAPVGSSGMLLPFSFSAAALWRVPLQALPPLELLGPPTVAWAVAGPGDSAAHAAVLLTLLPLALFAASLGLRTLDLARGTATEHSRRQRALAAGVLGAAGALYLWQPGLLGAALTCLLLLTSSLAVASYEITAAKRTCGPARQQVRAPLPAQLSMK